LVDNILDVRDLQKYFFMTQGILGHSSGIVKAVDHVSFAIERGKNLGVVGESGSGKTTLGKTLMRIYKPTGGEIWFNGEEVAQIEGEALKKLRRKMQMVFQDPASSLNPRRDIKGIIGGPLEVHDIGTRAERLRRVKELLVSVELSEEYAYRVPGALSGGEKQRVAVARALALNPDLVVLDEPTSSLDVSVQAKILSLLQRLQRELNLTYILITHELSVVCNFADRVCVMYLGELVESGGTTEIFRNPLHPYTKTLLSALPVIYDEELTMLPKVKPLPDSSTRELYASTGCRFHTRCPERVGEECPLTQPTMIEIEKGHFVACHKYS